MYTTVIIEDDPMITRLNRRYIEQDSRFAVVQTFSAAHPALFWLRRNPIDLIVLDVYMPQMSGTELLLQLRAEGVDADVIMVTSANDAKTVNDAVRLGAVDYLVKPFAMDLLTAKVQAVLRRVNAVQEKSLEKFGCELNLLTNDLDFQGKSVRLTPTEGLIMKLLMLNANQTVSKKKLISALWQGNNFIDENALNVNLSRLRGKLSTLEGPLQITTVRGQGYRLEEKL